MELEELKNKWKELDKHVKAQDEKIRELTERYKNDPVRLQMLSQIASELNECE